MGYMMKITKIISFPEKILFGSRWLLMILYLGLSLGLGLYVYKFVLELWEMTMHIASLTTETTMIGLLGLVDIVMVANLVVMVTIGSFSIFLKEIVPDEVKHRPRFMNGITASGLKTKLATSLIGISSIHLLKKFIESASTEHTPDIHWTYLWMMIAIHVLFIVSALALSKIDVAHNHKEPAHA